MKSTDLSIQSASSGLGDCGKFPGEIRDEIWSTVNFSDQDALSLVSNILHHEVEDRFIKFSPSRQAFNRGMGKDQALPLTAGSMSTKSNWAVML